MPVSTQRLPPEDPEPDDPPEEPDDPEPPDDPELGDPFIPPPEPLPALPGVPLVPDELDPLLPGVPEVPWDPDCPGLDEPGFPVSASGLPLADEALLPELDWPSPCDELPRSRLEPLDEPLIPPLSLLDEPEVFWSRSAMILPSKMLWTYAGAEHLASYVLCRAWPTGEQYKGQSGLRMRALKRRHCLVR